METIALLSIKRLQSQSLANKLNLTKVILIRKPMLGQKHPKNQQLTINHVSCLSSSGKKETSATSFQLKLPLLRKNMTLSKLKQRNWSTKWWIPTQPRSAWEKMEFTQMKRAITMRCSRDFVFKLGLSKTITEMFNQFTTKKVVLQAVILNSLLTFNLELTTILKNKPLLRLDPLKTHTWFSHMPEITSEQISQYSYIWLYSLLLPDSLLSLWHVINAVASSRKELWFQRMKMASQTQETSKCRMILCEKSL